MDMGGKTDGKHGGLFINIRNQIITILHTT